MNILGCLPMLCCEPQLSFSCKLVTRMQTAKEVLCQYNFLHQFEFVFVAWVILWTKTIQTTTSRAGDFISTLPQHEEGLMYVVCAYWLFSSYCNDSVQEAQLSPRDRATRCQLKSGKILYKCSTDCT